jgi:hypothetical protein
MNKQEVLIYGQIDNNLIFAPEADTLALARKWYAVKNAKTWQDYIDFTSQDDFEQLIFEVLETLGYSDLFPNYLMGEDLSAYITDLYLPQPDDPFTTSILPGFDEGEYFAIPAQEMLAWLPEELQDNLGQIDRHPVYEFVYRIEPENELMVLQTLEAAGYLCKKNQELMEQAHGL